MFHFQGEGKPTVTTRLYLRQVVASGLLREKQVSLPPRKLSFCCVERTRGGPGGQRRRGWGEVVTGKDPCQLG
jgi:hypothetical protein